MCRQQEHQWKQHELRLIWCHTNFTLPTRTSVETTSVETDLVSYLLGITDLILYQLGILIIVLVLYQLVVINLVLHSVLNYVILYWYYTNWVLYAWHYTDLVLYKFGVILTWYYTPVPPQGQDAAQTLVLLSCRCHQMSSTPCS